MVLRWEEHRVQIGVTEGNSLLKGKRKELFAEKNLKCEWKSLLSRWRTRLTYCEWSIASGDGTSAEVLPLLRWN